MYFISDVIEMMDLQAFYEAYEGDGRRKAPFEPRMMLKVLIYAYATGVFSSRKIARKLEEDVASGARCGQLPAPPDALRFLQTTLGGFPGPVHAGGADRAGSGAGASGHGGH